MRTRESLRSSLRRAAIAAAAASLILGGALTPASAEDPPPPHWQPVSSVTTDAGVTATWEAATPIYSVSMDLSFFRPHRLTDRMC